MTGAAIQKLLSTLGLLADRGIYPAREQPHRPKDAFLFLCPLPGHDDTDPSFSVHLDGSQWKCWGCGEGGGPRRLLELLDGPAITPLPKSAAPKRKYSGTPFIGCTLAQLAEAKSLPIEHLQSLGWHDTSYGKIPAVAIPYQSGTRYRVGLEGGNRFRWAKGSKTGIYGVDQLEAIRLAGWVLFVEGETDVAAGRLLGLPVVGLPGAGTWKDDWWIQFQGCQIYAWQEPEKGGETFISKLADSFPALRVIESPPGIKDLCELLDQAGDGALVFFNELKLEAEPHPSGNHQPKASPALNSTLEVTPTPARASTGTRASTSFRPLSGGGFTSSNPQTLHRRLVVCSSRFMGL